MTESTEDKTKRRYLEYLMLYEWSYQYSFFYKDHEYSRELIHHKPKLTRALSQRFQSQPFLLRVQILNKSKRLQAYVTVFTTEKISMLDMKDATDACGLSECLNVMSRRCSDWKIESMANKIKEQKPHDLKRFFGSKTVKRWNVLNKKHLKPKLSEG